MCIPVSIIFSSLIHFQLSKINFILDFKVMMQSINVNKNHLQLFISFQALLEFFIVYLLVFNHSNSLATETNAITSYIKTPKVYGNGQYGTAKWNTKKEISKKLNINTLDLKKMNNVNEISFKKGGLVIDLEKNRNKEKLLYVSDDFHSLIVGSTGAGKTRRLLLPSLCNYLFAQESVICTDPKGEILQYTMPLLEKLGYKIITIDFKNPLKSNRYNFLQPVIDAYKNRRYEKSRRVLLGYNTSISWK